MKPGVYALASLDGSPFDRKDLQRLGLMEDAPGRCSSHGFVARAVDFAGVTASFDSSENRGTLSLILGLLDEPEELCRALDIAVTSQPSMIAATAAERFHSRLANRMAGEWIFLQWRQDSRELQVWTSMACRDPVFYSAADGMVALSAEQLRLGSLPWVGSELSPEGLLAHCSMWTPDRNQWRATPWKNIEKVPPAAHESFADTRHTIAAAESAPELAVWDGTFDDAVEALNVTAARVLRQNAQRHPTAAFLLSGGIDSTLITMLGSEQRDSGADMFCLCSAAPDGSNIQDEMQFSTAVADHLGVRLLPVRPPRKAGALLPDPAAFAWSEGPKLGPRFYLYDELYRVARAHGATALVDGLGGEFATNNKRPMPGRMEAARPAFRVLRRLRTLLERHDYPWDQFLPRFSKAALARVPHTWDSAAREQMLHGSKPPAAAPRGFPTGLQKMELHKTGGPHGIRHVLPYRDRRILNIVARLPWNFDHHGGVTRSLGRAMMKGRIPDTVRLRMQGKPFSPDFIQRVWHDAPAVLSRIPEYRRHGVGEWIDLPWLEQALKKGNVQPSPQNSADLFRLQSTCHTAEFLLWNRFRQ